MISVIVPIYNIEGYLKSCVDSILNSTYKDFELILVDDGSTDDSGYICDVYSEKDSRVKVIHKDNGGISDARNAGLKTAMGEYIAFVDGDDAIHPRMLEVLYDAINSGDYDFSMVRAQKVSNVFSIPDVSYNLSDLKKVELSATELMTGICNLDFNYQVVWNKMYRRSLIEDMRFEPVISEDMEWNTRISLRMTKALSVEAEMYYYLQRHQSIMNSGVNKSTVDRLKTYELALSKIPASNSQFRGRLLKTMYSLMFYVRRQCENTGSRLDAYQACCRIFMKTKEEFLHNDSITAFSKLRSLFGYYCPTAYDFLQNVFEKSTMSR